MYFLAAGNIGYLKVFQSQEKLYDFYGYDEIVLRQISGSHLSFEIPPSGGLPWMLQKEMTSILTILQSTEEFFVLYLCIFLSPFLD